ncbi:hypothetical protein QYF61_027922 [Mycteria americana]|uniref:Uncharacterized protein n=1 Tax=Mycteria americana TaxID=33587 RepID=A0AAN7N3J8_MYCAM|nr:hypothetical protein QYF61_027922 [Mycteria americana]
MVELHSRGILKALLPVLQNFNKQKCKVLHLEQNNLMVGIRGGSMNEYRKTIKTEKSPVLINMDRDTFH